MRLAVIANRRSGSAPGTAELQQALDRAGLEASIMDLPASPADADAIAARHGVLVAAGGDGTVSTVAAAAARADRVFGVIPAGTLNHFARDAGIPSVLDEAVRVLAEGRTRMMDVGDLNGTIFINNASLGAYPRMVWERNRARRRGIPRPLALALASAHTWIDLRSITVRLCVDGVESIRRSPFIFIGNSEYDISGTDIGRRPTMTDGRLSMYVAPRSGRIDALLLPLRALAGTLERHERFEAMTAERITIEPPRARVSVGVDGEIRMFDAPLVLRVKRGALRVIVPGVPRVPRVPGVPAEDGG
jgi:diacylglycerol kinase family enzyme